jgi:hypothetical protein
MKIVKYILSAVAIVSLAASCNHEPDGIVIPTTEPSIAAHGGVVVNDLTVDEDFTLVWSAAKFGKEVDGVTYTVSAQAAGGSMTLGTTSETNISCKNSALFEALGIKLTGNYEVTFKVVATASTGEVKESKPAVVKFEYSKITYLWVFGDYQGWMIDGTGPVSRLLQGSDGVFRGFVNVVNGSQLKLASQPNWDGTNYGIGATEGEVSADGDAQNFTMEPALYYWEVNLDAMTHVALKLETVSLIGEAVGGWNDGDDAVMSYDAASKTWIGIANLVPEKEYKVRFNKSWNIKVGDIEYDCSLGGDPKDLVFKGSNLKAEGEGITSLALSIFDYPYTIKETGAVAENEEVLYVANSTTGWNYLDAAKMQGIYVETIPQSGKFDKFTGAFNGLIELPEAGEYIFARMQTELGTRYGGDAGALVTYPGGAEAVGLPAGSGLSYVYANLNEGAMKSTIIPITSVGLVGGFNGWDINSVEEFTYDAASETWKLSYDFAAEGEYKIAFNKMWNTTIDGVTHQTTLGGSVTDLQINGGNLYMTAGAHTFELNLAKSPFTMAIDGVVADLSADPDYLEITGAFGLYNWNLGIASPALTPFKGEKGRYAGFVDMFKPAESTAEEAGFKVTYPGWSIWLGGALQEGTTYIYNVSADGGDMSIPFGLYFWDVTLNAQTKAAVAQAIPIETVNLIGSIDGTGWGQDFPMTALGEGIYTVDVPIDGEFKARMHEPGFGDTTAWAYNLGAVGGAALALELGVETPLAPDGGNLSLPAGNYTVTVNLAKSPCTMTVVAK